MRKKAISTAYIDRAMAASLVSRPAGILGPDIAKALADSAEKTYQAAKQGKSFGSGKTSWRYGLSPEEGASTMAGMWDMNDSRRLSRKPSLPLQVALPKAVPPEAIKTVTEAAKKSNVLRNSLIGLGAAALVGGGAYMLSRKEVDDDTYSPPDMPETKVASAFWVGFEKTAISQAKVDAAKELMSKRTEQGMGKALSQFDGLLGSVGSIGAVDIDNMKRVGPTITGARDGSYARAVKAHKASGSSIPFGTGSTSWRHGLSPSQTKGVRSDMAMRSLTARTADNPARALQGLMSGNDPRTRKVLDSFISEAKSGYADILGSLGGQGSPFAGLLGGGQPGGKGFDLGSLLGAAGDQTAKSLPAAAIPAAAVIPKSKTTRNVLLGLSGLGLLGGGGYLYSKHKNKKDATPPASRPEPKAEDGADEA